MAKTGISWTDHTWNTIAGCTRVSPGCANCYAFALHNQRYAANVKVALEIEAVAIGRTAAPFRLERKRMTVAQAARKLGAALPLPAQYDLPFAKVQLFPERLGEPLRWRTPQRVFVNSMSDLFHPAVPDEFIAEVFSVMARTPQHTFQVLTKRPERMQAFCSREAHWWGNKAGIASRSDYGKPLPNVWIGTSVEDQERADERIPLLLQTPAAVRFLSCEPLLGPINLSRYLDWRCPTHGSVNAHASFTCDEDCTPDIAWIIAGGESGPRARPCDLDWFRSLRDQTKAAGAAFHLKQLGGRRPGGTALLDGREWKEFPDAR